MRGVRAPLVMLLAVGAAVMGATPAGAPAQFSDSNPLEGVRLYVDTESPSWQQWQAYDRSGQQAKADLIWKIAREPRAMWLGRFTRPNFHGKVRRLIDAAVADGSVPLFTVLRAQSTGCGASYDGGGSAEDERTRAWYDDLARAIGSDRVVIAFEPDSLGTIDCHARSRRDDRIRLLRYGVSVLAQLPNATIYIEATASDWEPARRVAKLLRAVGVAKVRGFMLNATHYDWTSNNIRFGLEVSRRTGGKHFVINTAENGRGPVHYRLPNG
ncbi:MAG TPA: glycoside hydrolase family 6 protein, partial [Thermoleophilaceae bacterium]|nr:glycoside hydrolase family 6 protein [Thermoleophilaceae bacterium]